MNNDILRMPTSKLQRVIVLKKKIERLEAQLEKLVLGAGVTASAKTGKPRKRRRMSAEGRKRISEAAKARWAKIRAKKK